MSSPDVCDRRLPQSPGPLLPGPLHNGSPRAEHTLFWELSGDLFAVYDSEGRFLDMNPAWQRVLGWDREQLLGRATTDFMHPEDLEAAAIAASTAGTPVSGRIDDAESRYRCADGTYRWLMWSAYTDGEGWYGVGRDVTERKEAEAARDAAQRRATEAYKATGLSTWRWDPATDELVLSGEREELRAALGLPRSLAGTLQMVQPSHRSKVERVVTRVAEGIDERYCVRYPSLPAPGGTVRWFESRGAAVRDGDGRVVLVQGTTQDVTEAESSRLELLQSRNFNQTTLDSLDSHVAVLDGDGTIVFVNGAWSRFASENGSPGLGVGESYLEVCEAAGSAVPEAGPVARALRRMLAGSLEWYEVEYPCHSPTEERWFNLRAVLHRSEGPPQVVVQHQDITQRVLAQRGERLRARLLDEVDASVIATDLEGRVTLWSRGAEELYGWTEAEAVGKSVADLLVPVHFRDRMGRFVERLRVNASWEGALKLQRKDGSRFIAFLRSSVLGDDAGAPVGLIGVSVDATERVQAQEELRAARDYLAAVTDGMAEGLIAVDDSGGVLYMNATAEERLGWKCEELLGSNFHTKAHFRRPDGSPHPAEECPLTAVRLGGDVVRIEEDTFVRSDGTSLAVSYTAAPVELAEGKAGTVILFADLTEHKRDQWALRTSEAQLKAIIENTSAAIYVKQKGDYRYLLGNPEFERVAGIQPGTAVGLRDEDLLPSPAVEAMRETDRQVIEEGAEISLEEDVVVPDGKRTFLTLKFPLLDDGGKPYALCGISTDITEQRRREAEVSERLGWEERISSAVNEERLLVYAQPIMDLLTGAVVQEELLVRMRPTQEADEVILPAEFLPQAERFGLVGQIDRYMVRRGIELAAGGRSVQLNLSGQSIGDRVLTREIERELRRTGADPSKIVFEITETAAVQDIQAAREFSERIARLGCKCALDDFGTGYGSLTYQRNLVVQFLKIDMSFVRGMARSEADQQVVKSIVKLARDYGQQTVAEGVEDEETLRLLQGCGVDFAQGYHLGRPHPVAHR